MKLVRDIATSRTLTALAIVAIGAVAVIVAVRLFGLTLAGAIALYFVIWWISLFALLPVGVRSQAETGEVVAGTEPGAPTVPALAEKAIWTSVAAAGVLLLAAIVLPLAGL
jgi:predicted secreted protein